LPKIGTDFTAEVAEDAENTGEEFDRMTG